MKEKGIVKTQSSRSLPAKLTMNMLRGERILGLRRTCARVPIGASIVALCRANHVVAFVCIIIRPVCKVLMARVFN